VGRREFMTAWGISSYIDGVAEAGKAVYNIPMYITHGSRAKLVAAAGRILSSGGAVIKYGHL